VVRLLGTTLAITGLATLGAGLARGPGGASPEDALPASTRPLDIAAVVADSPTWMPLTPVAPTNVATALAGPGSGPTTVRAVSCRLETQDGAVRLGRLAARDPAAYRGLESGAPQAHQALVLTTSDATRWTPPGPGRPPADVVTIDGVSWRPAGRSDTLVMVADAEGAWTYAVVGPAGDVRSSGRTDSCLSCHEGAPFGELFGAAFR
jgi:hypothetical protein